MGGIFENWSPKNDYNGGFFHPVSLKTGEGSTAKVQLATYIMILFMIINYIIMLLLAVSILTVTYR